MSLFRYSLLAIRYSRQDEGEAMCLMCEEEDLYFLYLERMEREKRLARGEVSPPDANWLWRPSSPAQPSATADEGRTPPRSNPQFSCDAPEPE